MDDQRISAAEATSGGCRNGLLQSSPARLVLPGFGGKLIDSDFWTTGAQTMPVLALAIVVEARSIMSKWVPGERRILKSLQGLVWAAPLTVYAFAIPKCFEALAGGTVHPYWVKVISWGIALGVSSLVLNPALELLVRTNARLLAHIIRFLIMPIPIVTLRWIILQKKILQCRTQRRIAELGALEIKYRAHRHLIDSSEDAGSELNQQRLRVIEHGLSALAEQKKSIEGRVSEFASASADRRQKIRALREKHLEFIEVALAGSDSRGAPAREGASPVGRTAQPDSSAGASRSASDD
ncbi:hypothetical protein [Micromonospora sediminicola]|uniref:hypothetical protein n=1 Tax=Micromonospora sediminicola TaxID=946078 RepID=UPI00114788C1|nr:hypothetical protein [Micromonospora sediminicola]